jgi:hypothetical protein
MNNFAIITVFQFVPGKSVESFEKDEDFRIGTMGTKVGNRVRIAWNGTDAYEYVNSDKLVKLDKETFVYDLPWITAKAVETDKATESPKPARTPRNTAK